MLSVSMSLILFVLFFFVNFYAVYSFLWNLHFQKPTFGLIVKFDRRHTALFFIFKKDLSSALCWRSFLWSLSGYTVNIFSMTTVVEKKQIAKHKINKNKKSSLEALFKHPQGNVYSYTHHATTIILVTDRCSSSATSYCCCYCDANAFCLGFDPKQSSTVTARRCGGIQQ